MADNAYTLNTVAPARVQVLAAEVTRQTGYTHCFRLLYSDINGAGGQGDTVTVTLGSTPTNYLINAASLYVKTAFATSSGTPTITGQLGITGSLTGLIEAVTIKTTGHKSGQVALTDSSSGTASNTLAAITSTEPGDLAAVGTQLGIIKNAVASLAAKVNGLVKVSPFVVGTSSTSLVLTLTFENASGGEPDLLNAGELFVFVSMVDLDVVD